MHDLYNYIISDQNIYLAIYAVKSYVFDVALLNAEDKELLHRLADPFDETLICKTIKEVKAILKNVLDYDKNELFEVEVYFKPKDYDNGVKFRPLHTARLKTLIAMVAMLHVLIYEIAPLQDKNPKLYLSNYSKLIPSNFYGNRVSLHPEELFLNWGDQYKLYTQKANEYFSTFHETKEFRYELKLDLKNFFPSVDPKIVFAILMNSMPVTLSKEKELLKRIIFKLLVCKVKNINTVSAIEHYYGSKDNINIGLTKGIAQGLPQSYFFGNICMMKIAEIFEKQFGGKSVYYVDDSYIYTNNYINGRFKDQLEEINKRIADIEFELLNNQEWDDFAKLYGIKEIENYYGIKVHTDKKSFVCDVLEIKNNEMYVKRLSREASQVGSEMLFTYSQDEDETLLKKIGALLKGIDQEINEISERLSVHNHNGEPWADTNTESYMDKLIRYKKFFKYRELRLKLKLENEPVEDLIEQELQVKIGNIKSAYDINNDEIVQKFIELYKNDIWQVAIAILISNGGEEEKQKQLKLYLRSLIDMVYDSELHECAYLIKAYQNYMSGKEIYSEENIYASLQRNVIKKVKRFAQMNMSAIYKEFNGVFVEGISENVIDSFSINSQKFIEMSLIVAHNSDRLKRMFLNALYSVIFKVELSDRMIPNTYDKKGLTYGTLRVLLYLRNSNFDYSKFCKWDIDINSVENRQKIDYDILEILDILEKYVSCPIHIDNLIRVHKYTCEIWKNGAKHLYFYTLHNQEHAIDLIKNVVKLVKVISYIKISRYDYYIVFLACYLHDIAMVKIGADNDFLLDKGESEMISTKLENSFAKANDSYDYKKMIVQAYKDVDLFYENFIRNNHAVNSASEIRKLNELNFLETCVREHVAEVSRAHGMDVRDIYFVRGEAKNQLVSLKFDKILLRLADLLDMSDNRVSKPILNRNIDNMSRISAFHWVSHLLTEGYKLTASYEINKSKNMRNLAPGAITETIELTIYTKLSQFSKNDSLNCEFCSLSDDKLSTEGFVLEITKKGVNCKSSNCNFICRWFNKKNEYLLQELQALEKYLERVPCEDRYFNTKIAIHVNITDSTSIPQDQFEVLNKEVNKVDSLL